MCSPAELPFALRGDPAELLVSRDPTMAPCRFPVQPNPRDRPAGRARRSRRDVVKRAHIYVAPHVEIPALLASGGAIVNVSAIYGVASAAHRTCDAAGMACSSEPTRARVRATSRRGGIARAFCETDIRPGPSEVHPDTPLVPGWTRGFVELSRWFGHRSCWPATCSIARA